MRWRRGVVLAVLLGLAVSGCTPTARTAGPYAAKAVKTADAVHSAVASDLLLLTAVERGHTLAPYLSVATSRAEDDGSSAASTFLSIQPPNDKSDQLRSELSDLLDQAQSVLGDVRIAGRRGDRDAILKTRQDLEDIDGKLQAFAEAHQ